MSRLPRLLPLLGVAIGGVVAANALQGARSLPDLFSGSRAVAEEAAPAAAAAKAASPPAGAKVKAPPAPAPGRPLPPVCAPSPADLAKAAGLSPAELNILQNLQARRGQIESREKDLDTEVQLLAAAEAKVDAKVKAMNTLKAEVEALMAQADQKSQKDIDNLVVVYSKMKAGDAAAVMAQLDDRVRLPIAAAMKASTLSAILGKMSPSEAKVLTERLAHRFAPLQAAVDAGKEGAARKGPIASTDPAGAPAADASGPADAAPPAEPAKPRPRRVARESRRPPVRPAKAAASAPAEPAATGSPPPSSAKAA